MSGTGDNDQNGEGEREDRIYGPSEADMERFNREDAEYLAERKSEARSALWKLLAGGVFILIVASMLLNVLLPALNRRDGSVRVAPERIPAIVTRIIDGRTIGVEIDGAEQTIRYIGVETAPFGDPYYDIATAANRQWISGREVLLEADSDDADAEGRLLRYVWFDGAMVNLNLVASGLSRASVSSPNNRYNEFFTELEQSARSAERGIWKESGGERSASNSPGRSTDAAPAV